MNIQHTGINLNNKNGSYAAPRKEKKDSIEDILTQDSLQIGSDAEIDAPVTINFLYDKKLTSLHIEPDGKTQVSSVEAPGPRPVGTDPPMKVSILRNGKWIDSEDQKITGKNIAIMVHGFGGDSGDLLSMANHIQNEQNFDEIVAVDYDKGYHIDDISKKLAKTVDSKLPADAELTVISHSMGGLVSRGALEKYGLSDRVNKFIALGTPHTGVRPAIFYSYIPGSTPEYYDMSPGSEFLNSINDSKPVKTKYYSAIGTEGKYLTKYWTVKYLGENITNAVLGDKDNDGLVPSKSSGYDLMKECSEWHYKKFPVNHTYLHGGATLGGQEFEDTYKQVNAWLKE